MTLSNIVEFRLSTIDDAPAIARVHTLSWQSAYRGIVPDEFLDAIDVEEWTERHRRNMSEDPDDFVSFVAEVEGHIVGWALGGPNREADLDFAGELFTIYLLPDRLRRGIGRKLLAEVVQALVHLGFESLLVWVLAENWPARKFYEALGGIYISEKERAIGGVSLMEVSYGWRDMGRLLEAAK